MADHFMERSADISNCGAYRYELIRQWSDAPLLPFIMLNPSTADGEFDDPTIRRCMGFARRDGFGGIIVVNVFAFRTPSPRDLRNAKRPKGPKNHVTLRRVAQLAADREQPVVCAWGSHAGDDGAKTARMFRGYGVRLVCFGKTKDGAPRHPLYVRADRPLEDFA
jgi:hypothetical protein